MPDAGATSAAAGSTAGTARRPTAAARSRSAARARPRRPPASSRTCRRTRRRAAAKLRRSSRTCAGPAAARRALQHEVAAHPGAHQRVRTRARAAAHRRRCDARFSPEPNAYTPARARCASPRRSWTPAIRRRTVTCARPSTPSSTPEQVQAPVPRPCHQSRQERPRPPRSSWQHLRGSRIKRRRSPEIVRARATTSLRRRLLAVAVARDPPVVDGNRLLPTPPHPALRRRVATGGLAGASSARRQRHKARLFRGRRGAWRSAQRIPVGAPLATRAAGDGYVGVGAFVPFRTI